jgi:hypothetical protein
MADDYVQSVANELADLALADQAASGDIGIVDSIGDILGASSQTLQESYLTAVRVRRAETRARELLQTRQAAGYAAAATPEPAPLQGLSEEAEAGEDQGADASTSVPGNMPRRVKR